METVKASDLYGMSSYAIEFYEGVLVALDSLKKDGLSIQMSVFDTGNDTAKTAAILRKPEMKTMDLIIGPLYYKNFIKVADFAKSMRSILYRL